MAARIAGLFAAGETVAGANGANRLSGNAITEALVFGRIAGRSAARHAASGPKPEADSAEALALVAASRGLVATLIVSRGERGVPREARRYEVPYTPGQSVLDGLRTVRATLDPSLSIRHSCINANTCKECMIRIDGKVDYACTTRLAPREMILEPLPNKPWLRDLVTEIAPPDERLDHAIARLKP